MTQSLIIDKSKESEKKTIPSIGYASFTAKAKLKRFSFVRRSPTPQDVLIKILYCGICHSDLHQVNNDWGFSRYPMVPGHEIIGRVIQVGSGAKKFAEGDLVGVGCMVDSCRTCPECKSGEEQYCAHIPTYTYNSPERFIGGLTYGGYSNNIVVNEDFVLHISPNVHLESTAPLLCAGITTYSPMRHWNVKTGQDVAVIGLGGLGHLGIRFARSFGAHVVLITSSLNKREDAMRLGAHEVVISTDAEALKAQRNRFDFILDTVSAPHDMDAMLSMLKLDGHLVLVGLPGEPLKVIAHTLTSGRRSLTGSSIGGIRETQEMLDYCVANDITSDIEIIPIQDVNDAYARMLKGDVKYRFVIDLSSLK